MSFLFSTFTPTPIPKKTRDGALYGIFINYVVELIKYGDNKYYFTHDNTRYRQYESYDFTWHWTF